MRSYTVEQILAAEEVALAAQGQLPLMVRAATAVAVTAAGMLRRPLPGRRVVLLVGSGNNGGDALFAGANLARRGVRVTALLTDPSRAHPAGLRALLAAGGRLLADHSQAATLIGNADLIVDGLVGIGATPPLREPGAHLVQLANAAVSRRIAVDIPSGVHPDGGPADGPAFAADVTVTFGGAKTGLLLTDAAGRVDVRPLDFPLAGGPHDALVLDDDEAARLIPQPGVSSDKFSGGVLGIAAGSAKYPGAGVLCTGAAVRVRPGMVRFAGPSKDAVLARWPEVVATEQVSDAGRVQAWVVGPGLGTDAAGLAVLDQLLREAVPLLVDADGLTLLSQHPDLLAARHRRHSVTVLTPHAGEFGRLFPELDVTDRLSSVRAAAKSSGATVLLKGHRTVIADPTGAAAINTTGSPWLATAGSGDVLSGVIGSFLAAGLDALHAAALGAYLHGRAGERAEAAGHAGAQALWECLR